MRARGACRRRWLATAGGVLLLALAVTAPAQGARLIAGNDSGILGYFESAKPKRFIQLEVSGLDNAFEAFAGLDVRPASGRLWALTYAFADSAYRVYQVRLDLDARAAEASKRAGPFTISGVDENNLGFAFDPLSDEMRIVENGSDANLRLDATVFGLADDSDLAYATGDPNFGTEPGVQALGYTNQTDDAVKSKLFGIDEQTDSLVRINPAADGAMHTVGPLEFNTTYGFDLDITTRGDAFAILRVNNPRLFGVDLKTGEAKSMGVIGKLESGIIPGYGRPFSAAVVSRRLLG
jgi:trimeric autotransporter adhesin